ncbi:MAG TPA: hypothetical protein VMB74_18965 [Streptosporangiaceae bacterium]|nr:hypothetical protein [Streptosporangiaceae bacterium]
MTGTAAGPEAPARRTKFPASGLAAAAVLAAGVIFWAAFPLSAGVGMRLTLAVAIVGGVMSIAQLAAAAVSPRETDVLPVFSIAERLARQLVTVVRALPWAELMTVAAVGLEAMHSSRAWHTAVLGIALTCYLLAVHLAETAATARILRGQLPLLGIGAGLTALSVGAAALPGFPPGSAGAVVRIAVLIVAVVAVGLAVPVWLSRSS